MWTKSWKVLDIYILLQLGKHLFSQLFKRKERSWRKVKAKVRKDKGRERSVSAYSPCRTLKILSILKTFFLPTRSRVLSAAVLETKHFIFQQTLDFSFPKHQKWSVQICSALSSAQMSSRQLLVSVYHISETHHLLIALLTESPGAPSLLLTGLNPDLSNSP